MSYEIIQGLVNDLSTEFVLSESETLSVLLPILQNIKKEAGSITKPTSATKILNMNEIITETIESVEKSVHEKNEIINSNIIELKTFLHNEEQVLPDSSDNKILSDDTESINMDKLKAIESTIKKFSRLISEFCPGEIADLGSMLNILDQLIVQVDDCKIDSLSKIAGACKHYVENMTLEQLENTKPIEEGVILLQALVRHLKRGSEFMYDTDDILELLGTPVSEHEDFNTQIPDETEIEMTEIKPEQPEKVEKISDDDLEIIIDFVSEAEENLDNIEVYLVELEQDPHDSEIINNIFRPFHTIKGVSGFLSFTKINRLAHTTENLLDSARSGEFVINDVVTDAILESVDTLKRLIGRVKEGVVKGLRPQDTDINIESLIDRLQILRESVVNGGKEPIGEILVRKGIVARESIDKSLEIQKSDPGKKIGEILVQEKKATPDEVASALNEQSNPRKKVATQVKVSTQKLDDLVDYAGELVIAQSMLRQKTLDNASLSQNVAQLGQIVTNMQSIAMSMRMIPIKATFMKMIRLVRDLSNKSGKKISLTMKGEDTEIDRNVVDALYEPMVHMIRNSIDHGIESGDERAAKGKPSAGNIELRAYHKGGHIIIEIEDDGKGLDRDGILEKAKSSGLISENDQLTDAQVYALIMQPGFSTAKEVTDISGRGVGMDVVKAGIEKFRGFLNIDSSKDAGTKFTISLPLTLAIIDGMLVKAGQEKYVIPTIAIQKAFKPEEKDYFTVEGKGEMLKDRGNLIPVIRLDDVFGSNTNTRKKSVCDGLVVVVESKDGKGALLIDELLGKDEYVIKSLGNSLEDVKGLAGGAILGDGRVGLMLDIHGIFNLAF